MKCYVELFEVEVSKTEVVQQIDVVWFQAFGGFERIERILLLAESIEVDAINHSRRAVVFGKLCRAFKVAVNREASARWLVGVSFQCKIHQRHERAWMIRKRPQRVVNIAAHSA